MELNKAQVIVTGGGFELSKLIKANYSGVTHNVTFLSDDEGNPVLGVKIVGKNSDEYQANKNRTRIENIQRAGKRKAAVDTSTEEGATVISNTVVSNDHSKAVAVCVGWFGFNEDGQPATFTKDRIDQILTDFPLWEELVINALENDGNFMKV